MAMDQKLINLVKTNCKALKDEPRAFFAAMDENKDYIVYIDRKIKNAADFATAKKINQKLKLSKMKLGEDLDVALGKRRVGMARPILQQPTWPTHR